MNGNVNTSGNVNTVRTASIINLLAGIWLFISPWVYRAYSDPTAWNSLIVGALIIIFAAIRMSNPERARGASIVNMLLGAWTFASPWIYGYTGNHGRFINSLCVGVIVFICGFVASSMGHTRTTHTGPPPLRA
ncbi:MAG: SPW repeat protein [Bryobacterales bacterium]|nr:SPW repeat protein [Bryobacterales bacterium]MBV9399159.1 SPW repeat protein [Bryobacterales bacterium]